MAKAAKPKRRPGRPSKYSKAVIDAICERLSKGEPLAQICRSPGMPAYRTVKDWADEKDAEGIATARGAEVSAAIARARDEGFDAIAAECLRIADTPLQGVVEKVEPVVVTDPDDPEAPARTEMRVVERRVEDMLGHRKLQIETRLKLLSKWDPKRYGDRIVQQHSNDPDSPMPAPQFIIQPVAPPRGE
ncbi:hypothetical protein [Coralloluteibacterium thermophilus]|uniref:Terminase small subunit n=1 Tax=Coralloluteibacterium thermophilum TaxID=2707049 RepID=A0ABV9NK90_9GAMM